MKKKTVFILAMTSIMCISAGGLLLAQDTLRSKQPLPYAKPLEKIEVPVIKDYNHGSMLIQMTEEQRKHAQKYASQAKQLMMDHAQKNDFRVHEYIDPIVVLAFWSTIIDNDIESFDRLYSRVHDAMPKDKLIGTLLITFSELKYIGEKGNTTPLVVAITEGNVNAFITLYENINESERQEVLKETLAQFKLNPEIEKLISNRFCKIK